MKLERHHITPKCMLKHMPQEFVDRPENIIEVTPQVHVSLHRWLFMLTGDIGCEYAYYLLSGEKLGHQSSPEMVEMMSKRMSGKGNPMYGRRGKNSPLYGKPKSAEHRRKIGESNKGKVRSKEQREHHSKVMKGKVPWNKGKSMSEEQKRKISNTMKNRGGVTASTGVI